MVSGVSKKVQPVLRLACGERVCKARMTTQELVHLVALEGVSLRLPAPVDGNMLPPGASSSSKRRSAASMTSSVK
jgi:hypothetical protein